MKAIVFFILFTVSSASYAADVWSDTTKVLWIDDTGSYLQFAVEYSNSISTCDGGKRFRLDQNASDYDVQVSMLLAAFMADKELRFVFSTQSPTCAPFAKRLKVYK